MSSTSPVVVFLFTDIEGSTRLWEEQPERMRPAMTHHDAITRAAVTGHRGTTVKSTGDGIHAAFDDALDALNATLEIQPALAAPAAGALQLKLRCGLHAGADERRDGDFYGPSVNRAARVMSAAHGGQVLVSQAVVDLLAGRLPADASLRALGRVRLRDLASAETLHQLMHPRLQAEFPALRSLEATPNNLKQQLNSFVGREAELERTRQLLGQTRLLTLLGMGGIGKSRLSAQLAAEVLDDYPDGVWLVELAPLADPAAVPRALARVLGVKEDAERPIVEALARFVRDRRLLIVLDNCEHVLAACAALAKALLEAGPQVKVLASSRDYLQVAGETAFPVPTLSVPQMRSDAATEPPETLLRHAAVRLFADRARAAQADFRIDVGTAAAVAEISRRLDGIPLAIELAAARVRALSVESIAARLNDRFRLLVSGDSTVLPRQRTLRALIDWSFDLLSDAERVAFRRLAVFAGGWSLEAAEAVVTGSPLSPDDALELVTRLVEKSLVLMEPETGRYRMLDTVRAYALEKLAEAGDEAATRGRHLEFMVGFAERARPELLGPQQGEWLKKLDLDGENLLAAHAWCEQADDGAQFDLRLVFSLKFYWLNRGLLALGHQVSAEALSRQCARQRNFARCRGLCDLGQLCFYLGRYDEAEKYLVESLGIASEIGDAARVLAALQPLGMSEIGRGDLAGAREHLHRAVQLAEQQPNKRQQAAAHNALAQLDRVEGRLEPAQRTYLHVVTLARELGDQESIAIGLLNLAMVSIDRGARGQAINTLIEALDICEAIGSQASAQSVVDVAAALATDAQDWPRALRLFDAAQLQATRTGLRRDPADQAFIGPRLLRARNHSLPSEARPADDPHCSIEETLAEIRSWLLALQPPATRS